MTSELIGVNSNKEQSTADLGATKSLLRTTERISIAPGSSTGIPSLRSPLPTLVVAFAAGDELELTTEANEGPRLTKVEPGFFLYSLPP